MSRILFKNQHYTACITRAGFTVQKGIGTGNTTGRLLTAGTPECAQWVDAFDTAMDDKERAELARGFLL
jgi:hypothetical protein